MVKAKLFTSAGILKGITEHSVLEPILFVIFINDLPDDVTLTAKKFTDGTKVFHSISSHCDCLQLQDDLNRIVDWSQIWQMGFDEAKYNVFHPGSTNPCYEYSMRNTSLEAITE